MPKKPKSASSTTRQKKQKKSDRAEDGAASQQSSSSSSSFPPHLLHDRSVHRRLDVQVLHPGAVYVARNFLDASECDAWIAHAESANAGFESVCHPATRFIAHRECGRIQRTDWAMSERLYRRMKTVLDVVSREVPISNASASYGPVGCNGNLRLYKYERGMSFGRHYDGSDRIDEVPDGNTEFTVLIYLSSCRGGATRFYPPMSAAKANNKGSKQRKDKKGVDGGGGVAFVPEAGAILLHVHGDRCLEHEADPVESGVKYVLRTDIVYGTS